MTRDCAIANVIAALALLWIAPAAAEPASPKLDPSEAIAMGERAIGRSVANHALIDSTGAPFSLQDYRGKPLVISLIYTACS